MTEDCPTVQPAVFFVSPPAKRYRHGHLCSKPKGFVDEVINIEALTITLLLSRSILHLIHRRDKIPSGTNGFLLCSSDLSRRLGLAQISQRQIEPMFSRLDITAKAIELQMC